MPIPQMNAYPYIVATLVILLLVFIVLYATKKSSTPKTPAACSPDLSKCAPEDAGLTSLFNVGGSWAPGIEQGLTWGTATTPTVGSALMFDGGALRLQNNAWVPCPAGTYGNNCEYKMCPNGTTSCGFYHWATANSKCPPNTSCDASTGTCH